MSFRVLDALPILVLRFGETINKVPKNRNGREGLENKKVMGFRTPSGKVLALDMDGEFEEVKIWIEDTSAPPKISGIDILAPRESHDLHRKELAPLSRKAGIYLKAENKAAFEALLSWYS
ncbi:hypothetical protein SAMN05216376_102159 [Mameliella alba]|uniref:hypothetical protein n=1 Tax=Mameliella alba TaxID=561184 RepID=UPI000890C703|nr:hypothetical protein [Mameliella alba]OWV49691.1 hypothetical protein CDZ96_04760 [Mameliella alba]PTR41679.1 hypothetical protein LX94_00970 [Mameliella alba]GGF53553.1 hypothetical protein GCM10011319_13750 [Mameliella alba]SDC34223.1 hypothetical protein SAMN05216376_102159 [Mameliella alba]